MSIWNNFSKTHTSPTASEQFVKNFKKYQDGGYVALDLTPTAISNLKKDELITALEKEGVQYTHSTCETKTTDNGDKFVSGFSSKEHSNVVHIRNSQNGFNDTFIIFNDDGDCLELVGSRKKHDVSYKGNPATSYQNVIIRTPEAIDKSVPCSSYSSGFKRTVESPVECQTVVEYYDPSDLSKEEKTEVLNHFNAFNAYYHIASGSMSTATAFNPKDISKNSTGLHELR